MKKHLRLLSFLFLAALMLFALASCQPAQQTTTKKDIYYITYELYGGENDPNNPEVFLGSQPLFKPTKKG